MASSALEQSSLLTMGLRAAALKRRLTALVEESEEPGVKLVRLDEPNISPHHYYSLSSSSSTSSSSSSSSSDSSDEENQDLSGSILARTLLAGSPYDVIDNSDSHPSSCGSGGVLPPVSTFNMRGHHGVGYWNNDNDVFYDDDNLSPSIECDENGKSYFQLGNASPAYTEPTSPSSSSSTSSSSSASSTSSECCYRQQRMSVLHISLCKLQRSRQQADPPLRRSVLICNTVRTIENEMAREGVAVPFPPSSSVTYLPPPPPPPTPPPANGLESALCDMSSRATPFPSPARDDAEAVCAAEEVSWSSGDVVADDAGSINWGSVLSLPSPHSDLDLLNNNEHMDYYDSARLPALSAEDVLRSVPDGGPFVYGHGKALAEDLDRMVHVLVGT